jgi:2-dehydro-3-deoxygluconokinase
VTPVDVIGAGDAFVAGYLAARLEGLGQRARLQLGSTLGAFAVATRGDWEGLPRRTELPLLEHRDDVVR